jgi:hypothetical protein
MQLIHVKDASSGFSYAVARTSYTFNVVSVRNLRKLSADDAARRFNIDLADIVRRFLAKSWIALDASGSVAYMGTTRAEVLALVESRANEPRSVAQVAA